MRCSTRLGLVDVYGFKIAAGDIAVRGDGNVQQISGRERIAQELACWLIEPLGTDTIYRRFGSTLADLIGSPVSDEVLADVRAEVYRVVGNYIEYQKRQVSEAMESGAYDFLSVWSPDDIINSFDGIDIEAVADSVQVTVKLTTAAGETVTVVQTSV